MSRLSDAEQRARMTAPVIRNAEMGGRARAVGRVVVSTLPPAAAAAADPVAAALSRLTGGAVHATPSVASAPVEAPDCEAQLRAAREQAFEQGRQAGLDEQRHAMFEQGLRDGIAEGRAAGELEAQRRFAQLHEQAADRLRRVDEIGGALAGQWSEQLALCMASAEDEMVALCHAVICRFLGDSLVDRDGVSRLMRAAIEQWLQAGEKQMREAPVVVRVHPMDLDAMKADETLARWLVQQGVRGIEWQAGDEVALGGCVIQGPDGDLDARLETQLRNLQEQLARGRESRST